MSNLNTELMTALLKNESIDEVFRSHLEAAMNNLLKIKLTQFLGYEESSILGYNTGNSRNGFYERDLDTSYGRLHIKVPRDRNGHFEQLLIPDYTRRTDELETTIITLYKKGITQARFPFGLRTLSNGGRSELRGDDGIHQKTRCEAGAAVCFGWVSRNA